MNGMAAYQNDIRKGYFLGSATSVPVPQHNTPQTPLRSHSTSLITGLIPVNGVQPKLSMNPFATSDCVIMDGNGMNQSNFIMTTQYQPTEYQQSYANVMQRVYSSPVIMSSQQQSGVEFVVAPNSNNHLVSNSIYGADGKNDQIAETNDSLSLNIPLHDEPVFTPEVEETVMVETPETATTSSVNQESENEGEIDIQIRNVVCNFTLPLHIDLHRVALHSGNVTFDRGRGVLLKQKRDPSCFVKVYSSGKIYIVGCRSESECKRAARGVARMVQKRMGREADSVRIRNYKICNVLATCKMPFGIKIEDLAKKYPDQTQYEPELKVGLDWKCNDPKATLRIHTTGSITVLGAISENDVMRAIEIIYPIVREFRCVLRSRDYAGSRKRKQFLRSSSEEDLFFDVKRPPRPSKQVSHCGQRSSISSCVIGNKIYFSDEDDEFDDGV